MGEGACRGSCGAERVLDVLDPVSCLTGGDRFPDFFYRLLRLCAGAKACFFEGIAYFGPPQSCGGPLVVGGCGGGLNLQSNILHDEVVLALEL